MSEWKNSLKYLCLSLDIVTENCFDHFMHFDVVLQSLNRNQTPKLCFFNSAIEKTQITIHVRKRHPLTGNAEDQGFKTHWTLSEQSSTETLS
jgi:hypothetical protein